MTLMFAEEKRRSYRQKQESDFILDSILDVHVLLTHSTIVIIFHLLHHAEAFDLLQSISSLFHVKSWVCVTEKINENYTKRLD